MTFEVWLALGGSIGLAPLLSVLVTRWLDRRDKRDKAKAALARMLKDKEYELADTKRGSHTRTTDSLPPGQYADEIFNRRQDDRRSTPLMNKIIPLPSTETTPGEVSD